MWSSYKCPAGVKQDQYTTPSDADMRPVKAATNERACERESKSDLKLFTDGKSEGRN